MFIAVEKRTKGGANIPRVGRRGHILCSNI